MRLGPVLAAGPQELVILWSFTRTFLHIFLLGILHRKDFVTHCSVYSQNNRSTFYIDMVFSLRSIVSGLAILTVVHGHRLPARTTSTYNYNVPISAGFPKPTLTSGLLVDVHDPKEQYATLAPRKRPGNCNDLCALKLEGLGKSARLKFEGHCSSFLSTTIAHTVVT